MMDGRLSSFLSVNTFASSTACRPINKKSSRDLLLWAAKDGRSAQGRHDNRDFMQRGAAPRLAHHDKLEASVSEQD